MWKPLELEVHGPINYVALPRRQCYKSVVKGTPADWPAQQGLLPANGSVYPPNCFLNKPPLEARADGQNGKCEKGCTVYSLDSCIRVHKFEATTRLLLFHHLLKLTQSYCKFLRQDYMMFLEYSLNKTCSKSELLGTFITACFLSVRNGARSWRIWVSKLFQHSLRARLSEYVLRCFQRCSVEFMWTPHVELKWALVTTEVKFWFICKNAFLHFPQQWKFVIAWPLLNF